MPKRSIITGLVIRFDPAKDDACQVVLRALAEDDRYELGELMRDPPRLPLVLEERDSTASRDAIDELRGRPGVLDVAVVFIDLGGPAASQTNQPHMTLSSQG